MANDRIFFMLFSLCSDRNQFVFQVSDMFGKSDRLTNEELEYWICYNIVDRAKYHEVDYLALPMEEVIELCDQAERKRKKKVENVNKRVS